MSWLSKLERLLGLPPRSASNQGRIRRVFKAILIRPRSRLSSKQQQAQHPFVALIINLVHFLAMAVRDLAQPAVRLLLYCFKPLVWINKQLDKGLDWLMSRGEQDAFFQKTGYALHAHRVSRGLVIAAGTLAFVFVAQASLSLAGQLVFVLMCCIAGRVFRRLPQRMAHLCLMSLTLLLLARYIFWRFTSSLDLEEGMETFLGYTLLIAEIYTWVVAILGFIQTAWPLRRKPVQLSLSPEEWPEVDVFIPTYNEPISVVRPTVFAAKGMDWPAQKITIYLLDDGHRPEFEAFAKQVGVEYISRPDNKHAKAGNINHALKHTYGEFIAIFDCDHIPCRSFLQTTMGWMLSNDRNALVQTPHHFFSADPFEKNYDMFRRVPNEGELFYGLIQDGNDYWNATFFCGSCAVIRRKPLEEVGGIAVETVTEDAHTSLKMHRLGYESVYLGTPQAAGLATESLADHIGQRIRWARGMAQIFRTDNPFIKRGLSFFQRVCYANAMLHFFYGIPRLVFLVMPGAYLFLEYHVLNAAALTIMSFALPQLMFASYTNAIIQGKYRRSFWSEVYETVLSWYIVLPTTIAFINPKHGKFNVTSKGGFNQNAYFDANIAKPYLILMAINLLALTVGLFRLFIWNTHETGTVIMNLLWAIVNMILLGAAVGVAAEAPSRRKTHRVNMNIPVFLRLPGGYTLNCYTKDYSREGLGLIVSDTSRLRQDTRLQVGLYRGDREFLFPAWVAVLDNNRIGVQFKALSLQQESQLIQCTFGRADAWLDWSETTPDDKAITGLIDVIKKGTLGYARLYHWVSDGVAALLTRLFTGRKARTGRDF